MRHGSSEIASVLSTNLAGFQRKERPLKHRTHERSPIKEHYMRNKELHRTATNGPSATQKTHSTDQKSQSSTKGERLAVRRKRMCSRQHDRRSGPSPTFVAVFRLIRTFVCSSFCISNGKLDLGSSVRRILSTENLLSHAI